MRFKMSERSLFALLLRSPWWVSFLAALAVALVARLVLPDHLVPYGAVGGAPFLVVGCIAAWRQWKAPSQAQVDDTLATVNAMSWRDFSALLAEAFQRDGYLVKPLPGPAADLAVAKVGTHALVSGRRWKAAHQGIEPLRELAAAVQAHDEARQAVFVTAGALSDNALDYARSNSVQVLSGAALVQLLLPALRARKKPTVSPR